MKRILIIPALRYVDQTPIAKLEKKRRRTSLSPCQEVSKKVDNYMATMIKAKISESLESTVPTIIDKLRSELNVLLKNSIPTRRQSRF